jgi:predicted lipid-binding transport protein (Tim44 family)
MTIAPILGGLLGGALGGALVGGLAATGFGAPIAAAIGPTLIATMSGLGATAAGVLASKMTADDMISSPGYGNRTLVTPTGTFALNNNDTVMAGTNLFNKGTLQAPTGENSRLLDKIDRLVDTIQNATTTINVGGQVQRVPRFQLVGVHSRNEVE